MSGLTNFEQWVKTHDYDHAVIDSEIDLDVAFKNVWEAATKQAESEARIKIEQLRTELEKVKKERDGLRKINDRYSRALQRVGREDIRYPATLNDLTRST